MARLGLRLTAAAWLFVIGLWFAASGTSAQTNSLHGVYVQDEANVISQQTQDLLYSRAIWLHEQTGTAQISVVTVSTLNGRSLEEFAVDRFREMGLGDKARNDGVLLLYSAEDQHVRIEVGYGLEGRITDGIAGGILDQYFVPNRDAGQLDEAFSQTQGALVQEVAAEYGLDSSSVTDGVTPYVPVQEGGGFFDGMPGYVKFLLGIGVVILIIVDFKFTGGAITFAIFSLLGRGGRGGGGGGRGGFGGGRGGGGSSGGGGASR